MMTQQYDSQMMGTQVGTDDEDRVDRVYNNTMCVCLAQMLWGKDTAG
jgi:hypothetical protein